MENNFPHELAIKPSVDARGLYDEHFIKLQESAIRSSGIAGRVWEAAYLIKDYIDPRDDTVEYDPPIPWCRSGITQPAPDPHVVVELGAGLAAVGFAIAESLQKYRERSPHMSPEQLSNASLFGDVVVLTDLEDVCDKLLNPNLSHKASLWLTRTVVQTAILPREWHRGSAQNQCLKLQPEHERELSSIVQVAIRPLAWGSVPHVESLVGTLMQYKNTNAAFTIICSDLVYFPHLLAPLLRTLIHLTSPSRFSFGTSSLSSIIISYRVRSLEKETPFWRAFGAWFDFKPILCRQRWPNSPQKGSESFGGSWRRVGHDSEDTTFLFIAHRRPETLQRPVPKADGALLARYLDDTFESILMAERWYIR